MKQSRFLAIAAAAMLGAVALPATTAQPSAPPAAVAQERKRRQALRGGGSSFRIQPRRKGPGWTHAQVQRMAKKKRNQARNRRAQR